jgi:hypothetical protein
MATQSDTIISAASQRYGVIDYSRWQAIRWQWYSYVTYSATTAPSELNFFGQVAGQTGVTLADTNLPKAGSFGQTHFLLKTISTDIRLANNDVDGFTLANQATLDRRAIASDFLNGFVQAGVLEFSIGARPFATIPKPFQYAPPPGNDVDYENSFANQVGVVPSAGNPLVVGVPYATQTRNRNNVYVMDPNILIEAEQQFAVKLSYPSGAIPILATNVVDDTTNPLKVGIVFDGVLLRPMQ